MDYEGHILRGIDRSRQNRTELHPIFERGHEKAIRVLNTPEYSIQEKDFTDVYTQEEIDRDLAHVKKLEGYEQTDTLEEKIAKRSRIFLRQSFSRKRK